MFNILKKFKNLNDFHVNLSNSVDEYVYFGHFLKYILDNSEGIKIKLNKFLLKFSLTF